MVESYGQAGLLFVMVMQTLIAPIPSEAVLAFSGAVMGISDTIIYGGAGLIIGSVLAFFIARYGGRPIVSKMVGDKWIDGIDRWVSKHGMKSILFTRLIPVIPFDLISYISGVTSMKFRDYFVATVIGAIPRVFILAYLGSVAGGVFMYFGTGMEIIVILGILAFIAFAYMDKKGYIGGFENSIIGKLLERVGNEENKRDAVKG